MSNQGRFVWHDLNSTNVQAAKGFYGEMFGWKFKTEAQWDFIYTGSDPTAHFGTLMKLEAKGVPSHWVPYCTVQNIDTAIATATSSGAKIIVPKMPAGKAGFFSYVQDPQGAVFSLWQYNEGQAEPERDAPGPVGSFCWDELLTSDPAAAEKFYGQVVGYHTKKMDMPGMPYNIFERDSKRPDGTTRQGAGMMKKPDMMPVSAWMSYVSVSNCDASVDKAKRLGANILMPGMDIPNVGRFASMMDPSGAAISILQPQM
jgi:uncharacterized protein